MKKAQGVIVESESQVFPFGVYIAKEGMTWLLSKNVPQNKVGADVVVTYHPQDQFCTIVKYL